MKEREEHKAIIETLINTAAIALTTFGIQEIIKGSFKGYLSIIFGMLLEFLKYFGRHKKLW